LLISDFQIADFNITFEELFSNRKSEIGNWKWQNVFNRF